MFLLFNKIINSICFIEPEGESGATGVMDKEDVIDYLKDDSEPKEEEEVIELPKGDDKKEGEEKEGEVDELAELEDELKEPDEEKLELGEPVPRREILKKYPKIFEEFPSLERSYYRDRQFSEIFEKPADAQEAVEKAEVLDKFEADLKDGNILKVLQAANEDGSLDKIADNYLDTLSKVNEKAYLNVVGNVYRILIGSLVEAGGAEGQEILKHAATVVNQFIFGNTTYQKPRKLVQDEDPKQKETEDKVAEKEKAIFERELGKAVDGLNTKVNNALRNTIRANIDPRESMSDYLRNAASRDAYESIVDLIERDTQFNKLKDKLWDAAKNDDFSEKSLKRISDAYFNKGRTLLATVIKTARQNALKGNAKRLNSKDDDRDDSPKRKSSPPSNSRPEKESSGGKSNKYKGMSTLEAMMMED